jgi:acyl-CoA thioesterase
MTGHDPEAIIEAIRASARTDAGTAQDTHPAATDQNPARLERISPSTWLAHFEPDWVALEGIHGGLVVAVMLQAAAQAAGRRPATISAHLHAPLRAGRSELQADVIRTGRSAASVSVQARQTKLCATALVILDGTGDQSPLSDPPLLSEQMPPTPPQDTAPLNPPPGIRLPFGEHVEIRPTGDTRPLAGGDQAVLRAWIRPRLPISDPATRAVILLDALAPSLFATWREPLPVPTIELTIHLAPEAPETPWSAISQRTVWFNDAYCVDEADLRNEHGTLIAQARQRRRIVDPSHGSAQANPGTEHTHA